MIYFFYGDTTTKNTEKAQNLVASLLKKKPDASYFKLDQEKFNEGTLEELLESSALFESKYIVYGNRLFENKEYADYLGENIKRLKESSHIFILVEEKLTAPVLKKIKGATEKTVEAKKESIKKGYDPGIFALTDALGARNKQNIIETLHGAYQNNTSPEEVFNILVWHIKTMLISTYVSSEKEASFLGVKPFSFRKARSHAKNFTEGELKNLLNSFTVLFHESRLGKRDLDLGIEYLLLGV